MTVKKSPSDNGDCQPHTEDETFRLLKKVPYSELRRVLLEKNEELGNLTSEQYEEVFEATGWTRDEAIKGLLAELDGTFDELKKQGWMF